MKSMHHSVVVIAYRYRRAGLLVFGSLVLAAGCRRSSRDAEKPQPTDAAVPKVATPVDTARGKVQRVGSEPTTSLVLSQPGGSVLALRGAFLREIGQASGLEITIEGKRLAETDYKASPRGAAVFDVSRFLVRSADGVAAVDGVLNQQDGRYFLVASNGVRTDVTHLPDELRVKVGSWVFLVGPLDKSPSAYGVLAEKK